jgi:hypothetical protein
VAFENRIKGDLLTLIERHCVGWCTS